MGLVRRAYPGTAASGFRQSLVAGNLGIGAARGRQSTTNQFLSLGEPSHLISLTSFVVIVTARIGVGTTGDHALVAKRNALGGANVGWVLGSNGIGSLWARWKRATTNTTIESNLAGGGPGPSNWFRWILALDDSLTTAPTSLIDRGNDGRWAPVTWNVAPSFGSGAAASDSGQAVRIGNANIGTLGWQGEIAHVSIWPKIGGPELWRTWADDPRQYARSALFCAFPGESGNPDSIIDYSRRLATRSITNSGFYGVNGPEELFLHGARGLFDGKAPVAPTNLTAAVVTFSWAVPVPGMSLGAVTVVVPTAAFFGWAVPVPVVALGASALAIPAANTFTWAVPTPTLSLGALGVALPVNIFSWGLPVPTLALGALAMPVPVDTFSWGLPVPSLALGALTVALPVPTLTWGLPVPTLGGVAGTNLSVPSAVSFGWAVPVPTLALGAVSVTLPVPTLTWGLPTPTLSIPTPLTLAVPVVSFGWGLPAATLAPGALSLPLLSTSMGWGVPGPTVAISGAAVLPVLPVTTLTWTVPPAYLFTPSLIPYTKGLHMNVREALRTRLLSVVKSTTGVTVAVSAVNAGVLAGRYDRVTGSFLDDGFVPGDEIVAAGFPDAGANGAASVLSVTSGSLVVRRTLPDVASGSAVTIVAGLPETAAWENRTVRPPQGRAWFREVYRPFPSVRQSIGPMARVRIDGEYVVELMYPGNLGVRAVDSLVDALLVQFESGNVFTANGQSVTVLAVSRGVAVEGVSNYLRVPVTVRWYTYTYNQT